MAELLLTDDRVAEIDHGIARVGRANLDLHTTAIF
jgi:hypothetical protein